MSHQISSDYRDLPADPDTAFMIFEQNLSSRLLRGGIEETRLENRIKYVADIDQFIHVFGVKIDRYFDFGKTSCAQLAEHHFSEFYSVTQTHVSKIKMQLARADSQGVFTSVEISADAKEDIRKLVLEVKKKLDRLQLEESKKDNLFRKLNIFLDELDRARTTLAAFTAAQVQIASATGQAAEKLEPIVGLFERIMKAIGRGTKQQKQLPRWEEPKQIEGPKSESGAIPEDDGSNDDK